ncbi:MAG: outer membrane beta-barrel protein, partial [Bacteroidota bacterium]
FNTIDPVTGKRSYYPVNVNGNTNWNFGGNWNKGGGNFKTGGNKKPGYGFNLDANGGKYINFINGQKATTKSFSFNVGPTFSMEAEDKFDFNFTPYIGYNSSNSSLSTSIDNNYFTYGARMNLEFDLPGGFEAATDINADLRERIKAFSTNTNLVIWNARLTKKLFKKDAGRISLVSNDILDDNKGFTRTINSTFVSDDRFQRISRYFLLKFEWSFNKSPGGDTK